MIALRAVAEETVFATLTGLRQHVGPAGLPCGADMRMPRLNGWQRLWVVAVGFGLLVAIGGAWHQQERPRRRRVEDPAILAELNKGHVRAVRISDSLTVEFPDTLTDGEIAALVANSAAFDDAAITTLAMQTVRNSHEIAAASAKTENERERSKFANKNRRTVQIWLLTWLGSAAALYAAGVAIAWIRKGFA